MKNLVLIGCNRAKDNNPLVNSTTQMINLKVVLNYTILLKSLFISFSLGFLCGPPFLNLDTSVAANRDILKINNRMANSVDPDEMAHNEPSHLNLPCFQSYLFWSAGLKRLKSLFRFTYEKIRAGGLEKGLRIRSLFRIFAVRLHNICITKTCQYNFEPLKSHFQYSKTWVYRGIHYCFLFLLKHIDCGYSLEPPHRCGSNEYPQSF